MPNQFFSPEGDLENYFVSEYWLIDQWVGDTLMTWGNNSVIGQLGVNDTINRSTPVTTFAGGTNWKQVAGAVSGNFSAAIKTDGTLWIWGSNALGQTGINDLTSRSTPVTTFAGGTNWKQVSGGANHTAAIKTDGTLWAWGRNLEGQLGLNDTAQRLTPVTTFLGGTNWKQVACGGNHTTAIKTDGTLWSWGSNSSGQLGVNFTLPFNVFTPVTTFAGGTNWKQVAGGPTHTASIKTDGTLWAWGSNAQGQLGDNTVTTRSIPVTTFAGGTNWKQVSGGGNHTIAIKTDGTLWTWGLNNNGQIGDNTTTNRSTPVTTFAGGTNWKQVSGGGNHTTAIKTDGTLRAWGRNDFGHLGVNDLTHRSTPVTTFAGGTNWKQVACSANHTLAVTSGTDPTFFIS